MQVMKIAFARLEPITTALIFAFAAFSIANADTESGLSHRLVFLDQSQQPSAEEFVHAAKRTFYRRNFEFRVIDERTVRGLYKGGEYEIKRLDNGVEIGYVGKLKSRDKEPLIMGRLRNLKRDLVLELSWYLL